MSFIPPPNWGFVPSPEINNSPPPLPPKVLQNVNQDEGSNNRSSLENGYIPNPNAIGYSQQGQPYDDFRRQPIEQLNHESDFLSSNRYASSSNQSNSLFKSPWVHDYNQNDFEKEFSIQAPVPSHSLSYGQNSSSNFQSFYSSFSTGNTPSNSTPSPGHSPFQDQNTQAYSLNDYERQCYTSFSDQNIYQNDKNHVQTQSTSPTPPQDHSIYSAPQDNGIYSPPQSLQSIEHNLNTQSFQSLENRNADHWSNKAQHSDMPKNQLPTPGRGNWQSEDYAFTPSTNDISSLQQSKFTISHPQPLPTPEREIFEPAVEVPAAKIGYAQQHFIPNQPQTPAPLPPVSEAYRKPSRSTQDSKQYAVPNQPQTSAPPPPVSQVHRNPSIQTQPLQKHFIPSQPQTPAPLPPVSQIHQKPSRPAQSSQHYAVPNKSQTPVPTTPTVPSTQYQRNHIKSESSDFEKKMSLLSLQTDKKPTSNGHVYQNANQRLNHSDPSLPDSNRFNENSNDERRKSSLSAVKRVPVKKRNVSVSGDFLPLNIPTQTHLRFEDEYRKRASVCFESLDPFEGLLTYNGLKNLFYISNRYFIVWFRRYLITTFASYFDIPEKSSKSSRNNLHKMKYDEFERLYIFLELWNVIFAEFGQGESNIGIEGITYSEFYAGIVENKAQIFPSTPSAKALQKSLLLNISSRSRYSCIAEILFKKYAVKASTLRKSSKGNNGEFGSDQSDKLVLPYEGFVMIFLFINEIYTHIEKTRLDKRSLEDKNDPATFITKEDDFFRILPELAKKFKI